MCVLEACINLHDRHRFFRVAACLAAFHLHLHCVLFISLFHEAFFKEMRKAIAFNSHHHLKLSAVVICCLSMYKERSTSNCSTILLFRRMSYLGRAPAMFLEHIFF